MRFAIGQVINGRYRIKALLGSGGASEVYLAFDLDRAALMALKLITQEGSLPALATFQNEARVLTMLQHPQIVRFYGLESWNGLPYLVMDYIDGIPLSREITHCKPGMDTSRVLTILRQICPALNYAHTAGVIHCDIKPANILLRQNGACLIADFGIASFGGRAPAGLQGAGTHAYMAPELGQGWPPSVQSDIYSLGIVLYEMLTGCRPSPAGQPGGEPPPLRLIRPEIPSSVEAVVLKCLRSDPAQRYASMLHLLEAFEKAVSAQAAVPKPARAHSPAVSGRKAAPVRSIPGKRPAYLAIGLAVIIVAVLGLALAGGPPAEPAAHSSLPRCRHFNPPWSYNALLEECVTRVEVQPDGRLKVFFQWNVLAVGSEGIRLASDEGNHNMYLTDNLNSRLDFIAAGDQAVQTVDLFNGQSKAGWFLFPAPDPAAHTFSFHDDDNGNVISGIEIER